MSAELAARIAALKKGSKVEGSKVEGSKVEGSKVEGSTFAVASATGITYLDCGAYWSAVAPDGARVDADPLYYRFGGAKVDASRMLAYDEAVQRNLDIAYLRAGVAPLTGIPVVLGAIAAIPAGTGWSPARVIQGVTDGMRGSTSKKGDPTARLPWASSDAEFWAIAEVSMRWAAGRRPRCEGVRYDPESGITEAGALQPAIRARMLAACTYLGVLAMQRASVSSGVVHDDAALVAPIVGHGLLLAHGRPYGLSRVGLGVQPLDMRLCPYEAFSEAASEVAEHWGDAPCSSDLVAGAYWPWVRRVILGREAHATTASTLGQVEQVARYQLSDLRPVGVMLARRVGKAVSLSNTRSVTPGGPLWGKPTAVMAGVKGTRACALQVLGTGLVATSEQVREAQWALGNDVVRNEVGSLLTEDQMAALLEMVGADATPYSRPLSATALKLVRDGLRPIQRAVEFKVASIR